MQIIYISRKFTWNIKHYGLWKIKKNNKKNNKRAMMALYRSPEYHSTQGEYDLIRGTFLQNFEIRP